MTSPKAPPVGLATQQRFALTDAGNAERFVQLFEAFCRFEHGRGRWLLWDNLRWAEDKSRQVLGFAIRTARAQVTIDAEQEGVSDEERRAIIRHALDSERARRLESTLSIASTRKPIAVQSDQLDADPWVLNTKAGTLDLKTGTLRPPLRADLITKLVEVVHEAGATCPTWDAFLTRVTGGNQELEAFLRRAAGYSLTGDVSEHALFLLYGTGANGKSTFLEVLMAVLGDYARAVAPGLLMRTRDGRHEEQIAELQGVRFAVGQESGVDQSLDEPRLKYLTGGDTVSARRLYAERFEFRPTHKLWIATNHKPRVRGGDDGIWRRLKLIPFEQVISEGERDPRLKEKLLAEAAGILNWAVRGCLEWQRAGLGVPEEVREATASYRASEDQLGPFLEGACVVAQHATVTAAALFDAYRRWADGAGERAMSQQALAEALEARGFVKRRSKTARMWLGLALRTVVGDAGDGLQVVSDNSPRARAGERLS